MDVSKIWDTPKSSILIRFSLINHPLWGYHYFWKHPYHHHVFETGAMWILLGIQYHWCLGGCLGHCYRSIGFIVWTATGGLFLKLRKWRMSRPGIFLMWKSGRRCFVTLEKLLKKKLFEWFELWTPEVFTKKNEKGWFQTCFAKCVSPKKKLCQEDALGCVFGGPTRWWHGCSLPVWRAGSSVYRTELSLHR